VYNSRTKCRIYFHVSIGCDPGLSQEAPFTFRDFGHREFEMQGSRILRHPETRNPIHTKPAPGFHLPGLRVPGFHDVWRRGFIPFGFLGAATPKPIYLLGSFRGFASREFAICEDKGFSLGYPGAETPKYQTLATLYHFGVSHIGISRYARTRGLASRIFGSRNSEAHISTKLTSGFRKSGFRDVQ
jgi:hypothetical protein